MPLEPVLYRRRAMPQQYTQVNWGYLASPLRDCDEPQTMRRMKADCPLSHLDGGCEALHLAEDIAINWLMEI